eukprot:1738189-Lingulodinium_polyedra.AAC.1
MGWSWALLFCHGAVSHYIERGLAGAGRARARRPSASAGPHQHRDGGRGPLRRQREPAHVEPAHPEPRVPR